MFKVKFKIKTKNGVRWYSTIVQANSESYAKILAYNEARKEYTIIENTTECERI